MHQDTWSTLAPIIIGQYYCHTFIRKEVKTVILSFAEAGPWKVEKTSSFLTRSSSSLLGIQQYELAYFFLTFFRYNRSFYCHPLPACLHDTFMFSSSPLLLSFNRWLSLYFLHLARLSSRLAVIFELYIMPWPILLMVMVGMVVELEGRSIPVDMPALLII